MKRLLALVAVLILAPAAAAAGWPGPPRTAAPRLTQQGPPPAWVETRSRSTWMAFSSYCWRTPRKVVCADAIPPQSRTDLPEMRVARGTLVRLHLGFRPRSAHLTVFRGVGFRHFVLAPRRVLAWRAATAGVASLDVRAGAGGASYLVRMTIR